MPDARSEFDQGLAKFETPGRACRQAVPEWPVFAQSGSLALDGWARQRHDMCQDLIPVSVQKYEAGDSDADG